MLYRRDQSVRLISLLSLLLASLVLVDTIAAAVPDWSPDRLAEAQTVVSLTGRVTGADSGAGLAEVRVTVLDARERWVASGTTDASGSYDILLPVAGSYRVQFLPEAGGESTSYIGQYHAGTPSFPAATPVSVAQGTVLNAVLQRGGVLTGRIAAADSGANLADVTVLVFSSTEDVVAIGTSDTSGIYITSGIPAGQYRVQFLPEVEGPSGSYIPQFADNKPTFVTADEFAISGPRTILNGLLQRGSAFTGRIIGADTGRGLPAVTIYVYDERERLVMTSITDDSGTYHTNGVAPGDYRLQVVPDTGGPSASYVSQFLTNKRTFAAADPLRATGAPQTVVNATLQRGRSLTGTIVGADTGAGLPDVLVLVYLEADAVVAVGTTDEAGRYVTTGIPAGGYRVEFLPDGGGSSTSYIAQFADGAATFGTANPLQLGIERPPLNGVLKRGTAITGRVTGADSGVGLANVTIAVYGTNEEVVLYGFTNASGHFATSGLPAGAYRVEFSPDDAGVSRAYQPEFYYHKPDYFSADVLVLGATPVVTLEYFLFRENRYGPVSPARLDPPARPVIAGSLRP